MVLDDNNYFIVKKSNYSSTLYYYNENTLFSKDLSSYTRKEISIAENCKNTFSVSLTTDDDVKLFYLKNSGDVYLIEDWTNPSNNPQLIKRKFADSDTLDLKSVIFKDEIFLLYNVLNKDKNSNNLLLQEFDSDLAFFNPKYFTIVENNIDNYIKVFSNNRLLVILYQMQDSTYKLGYKYYNGNMKWSSFKVIAESKNPFENYSVSSNNKNIFFVYIKNENASKSMYVTYLTKNILTKKLIYSNSEIRNLESFILNDKIYFTWSENNSAFYKKYKYTDFSVNSEIIEIDFDNELSLCTYLTNVINEKQDLVSDKLFFYLDNPLELPLISEVLPLVKPNTKSSHEKKVDTQTNRKEEIKLEIEKYKNRIKELEIENERKDKKIIDLVNKENEIIELKSKIKAYERKFINIRNQYTKFDEIKDKINSKLISLQDNIMRKDKKIIELQNIINEKNIK